jgi:hypothetical protein
MLEGGAVQNMMVLEELEDLVLVEMLTPRCHHHLDQMVKQIEVAVVEVQLVDLMLVEMADLG